MTGAERVSADRSIYAIPEPTATRVRNRLAAKAGRDGSGCWPWRGSLDKHGYGRFPLTLDGLKRFTGAHRASWLALRGPIPRGLQLDHLCRNRACVNPDHLELVTSTENTRRAAVLGTLGRPRKPGETRGCGKHGRDDGYEKMLRVGYLRWVCRPCARARAERWKAKRKAAPR